MTAPDCPDAAACPVPDPAAIDLRRLRVVRLAKGWTFHTAYLRARSPALFNNSNRGNARFSPLSDDGGVVPTMYGAQTRTVALLETAFHDVHQQGTRIVSESVHLAPRGLVALTAPVPMALIDLTDDGLARIGLERRQLVSTTPAHYACTREWATALHRRRIGRVVPAGMLWRSRVAELAGGDSPLFGDLLPQGDRVCLLFGDRLPTAPARWRPGDPREDDLTSGQGRLLSEQIAEQLGAVIVPI